RHSRDLHPFPTRRSSDLFTGVPHRRTAPDTVLLQVSRSIERQLARTVPDRRRLAHNRPPTCPSTSATTTTSDSARPSGTSRDIRSEEHTSELQSREKIVC